MTPLKGNCIYCFVLFQVLSLIDIQKSVVAHRWNGHERDITKVLKSNDAITFWVLNKFVPRGRTGWFPFCQILICQILISLNPVSPIVNMYFQCRRSIFVCIWHLWWEISCYHWNIKPGMSGNFEIAWCNFELFKIGTMVTRTWR